jgi:hypothetical protein
MKINIDNQVVRLFLDDAEKVLSSPLGTLEEGYLSFNWPSLLEYLGLGTIFSQLPPFDKDQILFKATVSALCEVENPEDLFYIYDSLFTEMLKQVKSLPEVDAPFLLQKMAEKKGHLSFWAMEKVLSPALSLQEKMLRENAPNAMHDLVLYLAWDRMCVCMARLFDYQSNDPKFLLNLRKLRWCLVESYQHISSQGRTSPSFSRLMEALFYYQMREEHLQIHPEADWELLSQSFQALKDPKELIDFSYIDHAIVPETQTDTGPTCHLTADSPEIVQSRLALAHYMIGRLKEEIPEWRFALRQPEIFHV